MSFDEEKFRLETLNKLKKGLSPELHYHHIAHTLDIFDSAVRLAGWEAIEGRQLILVKVAALLHDVGFIRAYNGHEEESCVEARQCLPIEGFSEDEVELVCGMIMATKLPQSPQTHLEMILCDADLDYLGRDDYDEIAPRLYKEILARDASFTEEAWLDMQVSFLSSHTYFTESARKRRQQGKEKKLKALIALRDKRS
jgi:predicted metal-dependent HD superfamily phosphohydrolase